MKSYNFHAKTFIIIIVNFSLAIVGLVLFIKHEFQLQSIKMLLMNSGIVISLITVLYKYFERFGWKQQIWSFIKPIIRFPPNLNGRWEGEVQRITHGKTEKFVIEIAQTMTKLQVFTYSESKVEAESIMESIACDVRHEKWFKLCYLWEGLSYSRESTSNNKYMGYTILKLIQNGSEKRLEGEYFTNKGTQQTRGIVAVKWVSAESKRRF